MGLIYEVRLPVINDSDVIFRTLKVDVDGVETIKKLYSSDTVTRLNPVKEGAKVTISVQDVDDAGNASEWSDPLSFTAKDTIPPHKPGLLSASLIDEIADDPAVVVPPTPPAPEPPVVHDEPVVVPVVEPEPEPAPTKVEE